MNIFSNQLFNYLFAPKSVYLGNIVELKKQSVFEIILFGWVFFSLYGLFNISFISLLSSGFLNSVFESEFLMELSLDYFVRYKLIIYLISIFLFPVSRLCLYYYLDFALKIFDGNRQEARFRPDPVLHLFYADFFYLIPFIGGACRFFAALIYFFKSMSYGSNLSRLQILLIIIAPVAFVFFSFVGLLFFCFLAFNSIAP